MRMLLAAALVALLAPGVSTAAPLQFEVSGGGELAVSFGLDPFELTAPFSSFDGVVSGSITIVSGPLLDLIVDDPFTSYRYGSGLLTLDAEGFAPDGTFVQGTFTAPTDPFWIDLEEDSDDLFGGAIADDFEIGLGPGLFDPELAKLLGVDTNTFAGFIDFGLEAITGDPDSRSRTGFDHRGFANLEIDAVEVPEPASLLLMVTAGAAWFTRRRRYLRSAR